MTLFLSGGGGAVIMGIMVCAISLIIVLVFVPGIDRKGPPHAFRPPVDNQAK